MADLNDLSNEQWNNIATGPGTAEYASVVKGLDPNQASQLGKLKFDQSQGVTQQYLQQNPTLGGLANAGHAADQAVGAFAKGAANGVVAGTNNLMLGLDRVVDQAFPSLNFEQTLQQTTGNIDAKYAAMAGKANPIAFSTGKLVGQIALSGALTAAGGLGAVGSLALGGAILGGQENASNAQDQAFNTGLGAAGSVAGGAAVGVASKALGVTGGAISGALRKLLIAPEPGTIVNPTHVDPDQVADVMSALNTAVGGKLDMFNQNDLAQQFMAGKQAIKNNSDALYNVVKNKAAGAIIPDEATGTLSDALKSMQANNQDGHLNNLVGTLQDALKPTQGTPSLQQALTGQSGAQNLTFGGLYPNYISMKSDLSKILRNPEVGDNARSAAQSAVGSLENLMEQGANQSGAGNDWQAAKGYYANIAKPVNDLNVDMGQASLVMGQRLAAGYGANKTATTFIDSLQTLGGDGTKAIPGSNMTGADVVANARAYGIQSAVEKATNADSTINTNVLVKNLTGMASRGFLGDSGSDAKSLAEGLGQVITSKTLANSYGQAVPDTAKLIGAISSYVLDSPSLQKALTSVARAADPNVKSALIDTIHGTLATVVPKLSAKGGAMAGQLLGGQGSQQ